MTTLDWFLYSGNMLVTIDLDCRLNREWIDSGDSSDDQRDFCNAEIARVTQLRSDLVRQIRLHLSEIANEFETLGGDPTTIFKLGDVLVADSFAIQWGDAKPFIEVARMRRDAPVLSVYGGPKVVTKKQIVSACGLRDSTNINAWKKQGFPPAISSDRRSQSWHTKDVLAWLKENDKAKHEQFEKWLLLESS